MKELEIVRYSRIEGVRMFFNTMDYRTNHFHEEWEILLVVDQPLILLTSSEKKLVRPGDVLVFPPYLNHEIQKVDKSCTFLCLQIAPEVFPACPSLESTVTEFTDIREFFAPDQFKTLQSLLFKAMDIYLNLKDFDELHFMSVAAQILFSLLEHVPYRKMTTEELNSVQKRGERLLRFKKFVDENFRYKIRLADFAAQEQCSLSYMSAFIKEGLNLSFRDYVTQVRFYAALKMMAHTSKSLQEISSECGFSDYRYFSAVFQERTGKSPKEFRRQPVELNDQAVHVHQTIHSLEYLYPAGESRKLLERFVSEYHASHPRKTEAAVVCEPVYRQTPSEPVLPKPAAV